MDAQCDPDGEERSVMRQEYTLLVKCETPDSGVNYVKEKFSNTIINIRRFDSNTATIKMATYDDLVDDLNLWFCQPPKQAPYPNGSLLHWSSGVYE